jgi:hypothetical protein
MVIHHNPGRPGYCYRCARWRDYRDCSGSWPLRTEIEQAVKDALAEWAADIESHGHATQVRRTTRAAAEVVAARAGREVAAANKALTRLAVQAATDEEMPESVYADARADLLEARSRALAEQEKAEAAAGEPMEDFPALIDEVLTEWDLMPVELLRTMLARLVRHVTSYRTAPRRPARIVVTPVWEDCSFSCCAPSNSPSGALYGAPQSD